MTWLKFNSVGIDSNQYIIEDNSQFIELKFIAKRNELSVPESMLG